MMANHVRLLDCEFRTFQIFLRFTISARIGPSAMTSGGQDKLPAAVALVSSDSEPEASHQKAEALYTAMEKHHCHVASAKDELSHMFANGGEFQLPGEPQDGKKDAPLDHDLDQDHDRHHLYWNRYDQNEFFRAVDALLVAMNGWLREAQCDIHRARRLYRDLGDGLLTAATRRRLESELILCSTTLMVLERRTSVRTRAIVARCRAVLCPRKPLSQLESEASVAQFKATLSACAVADTPQAAALAPPSKRAERLLRVAEAFRPTRVETWCYHDLSTLHSTSCEDR
mgnify:FL=1